MRLEAGDTFAGYEIVAVAGEGAMATTYRARRLADDQVVAIKIPQRRCFKDPTYHVRFLQEAHLGTRLRSQYIVRVFEAGEEQGTPFIAMEYLTGMTLKEALAASGRVALRRALGLAHNIAEALEHAHSNQVVHRDLKPDNIMVRMGKCLKVMDFGIAKMVGEVGMTSSNMFIGTPYYAAPEMVDSRSVDHRADLYSLGIILFEMLQGEVPFGGRSPMEVILKHVSEPFPAREDLTHRIPKDVYRLLSQLARKSPDERLPNARSLRVALEMLLATCGRDPNSQPTPVFKRDRDDDETS